MKKFLGIICLSVGMLFSTSSSANQEEMSVLDTIEFEQLDFPSDQYVKEETSKTQICLHHTASGKGVKGDFRHWTKSEQRIATCVILDDKGVANQLFSSKYWAYHLGIKKSVFSKNGLDYRRLDKSCIGLEIDSWGPVKLIDGEWRAWPNDYGQGSKNYKVVIPESELTFYPNGFRGYEAFQSYTNKQIESTSTLLKYWGQHYGIPLNYNSDMWDVSKDALSGKSGVYSHVSYRKDKSDCHPQPELIKMLKSLS